METDTPTIKRRADGSIDTAHYITQGRNARNHQAHLLAGKSIATVCILIFTVLAVLVTNSQGIAA